MLYSEASECENDDGGNNFGKDSTLLQVNTASDDGGGTQTVAAGRKLFPVRVVPLMLYGGLVEVCAT